MDAQAMMNSGMNFGVMNAMRTGNPILDVLICMLIPVLLGVFMGHTDGDPLSTRIIETLRSIHDAITGTKTYIRYIVYENRGFVYEDRFNMETSEKNNILQKAIKLYIQETCKLAISDAEVYLLPSKSVKLEKDQYGDACLFNGTYKQLLSYKVSRLPKKEHWMVIDEAQPELCFRQSFSTTEEGEGQGRKCVRTLTFELRSRGSGAVDRVDSFIDKAFDWYKHKKSLEVDPSRYLYQPQLKSGGSKGDDESDGGGGEESRNYKRYILADTKTFDTIFFPEKEGLLKLVDDFRHCRGKFSIPGFPNKLGLLLDGPPGTGKTSLIKALAIHLKRHIVSVSLEKVKTNQELTDLMFDLCYTVKGEDEPIRMKFDEVIFVMEDVDCASSVVYARKQGPGAVGMDAAAPVVPAESTAAPAAAPTTPSEASEGARPVLRRAQSTPADYTAYRKSTPFSTAKMLRKMSFISESTVEEEDEEEEEAASQPPATSSSAPSASVAVAGENGDDEEAEELENKELKAALDASVGKKKSSLFDDLDKLNLSGLLNVLDGVVDTPGRVLVMTTNHPEKLDPALIRPGRINKRLHLGYVTADTLLQMAKHYACRDCDLPSHARREAEAICGTGRGITPAWVEQCAAESDDFDNLIKNLQILKGAAPPGVSSMAVKDAKASSTSDTQQKQTKKW